MAVNLVEAEAFTDSPFQRSPRSNVWKHFTRNAAKDQATCNLCKVVLSYKGSSTTSLHRHLSNRHPSSASLPEQKDSKRSTKQTDISVFAKTSSPASSRPVSTVRQREITEVLSRWPWLDGRPISIVNDAGLRELLHYLEPGYSIPSTTHIAALIRKQHDDGLVAVKELLSSVDHLSLTTDIWTSKATRSYATTTAHWINGEWELQSCVLETTHFSGSHTGIKISEQIMNAVSRFDVPAEKVCAVVHDQAANAELAGKILLERHGWESCACSAHCLQNAVKDALQMTDLETLLSRARHLVGHFRHSALKTGQLEEKQRLLKMSSVKHVIQDCPTRWNSAYLMLARLVELRTPIQLVLADMPDKARQNLDLTVTEWTTAKLLLAALSCVDEVTKHLGGEKYSTLSWHLPLLSSLCTFCDDLNSDDDEPLLVTTAKSRLGNNVNRRFELDSTRSTSIYAMATALDPRFRDLKCMTNACRAGVKDALISAAAVDCQSDDACQVSSPSAKRHCPDARSAASVLDDLLGGENENDESIQAEVELYLNEKVVRRAVDPLVWWNANASRFPRLAAQAKRYLCIPATSVPSERVFSFAGYLVDKRRCSLSSTSIDALIFLHCNAHLLRIRKEGIARALPAMVLVPTAEDDMPPLPSLQS